MGADDLYESVWQEDDATTKDPDHETLEKAAKRVTSYSLDSLKVWARQIGATEDHGDAFEYRVMGWKVIESYPGASAIYKRRAGT